MAATRGSLNSPWAGYYNQAHATATTYCQQACNRRLRARPTRTLFITVAACFFLIIVLIRSSSGPSVDDWLKYPTYHFFHDRPENSQVVPLQGPTIGLNDSLPTNLTKSNPSFHLVIPARKKNSALCRLITSAMILNYPPPTLVQWGRQLPEGSREYDSMLDRITSIYNFLAYTPHVREDDFVLLVDGQDFFFQLPPEVMIQRFQSLLRENNAKLLDKYGLVAVEKSARRGADENDKVQKYSQRVLFSASKECFPNLRDDAGCVAVPSSSLPPDVYGWKTDTSQGQLVRPRWIKPGAAIGQAGDLKAIYAELLHFVDQHRNVRGDYLALTQMYGRQEYVRELERRRTSSWLKEFIYRQIGISDAGNITGIEPHLENGRRYEYGIGIDFESRLFFNMFNSKGDVEWLKYNNITKTSSVQMEHAVPREHRLLLPADLSHDKLANPFIQPKLAKDEWVNPPWNKTLDLLPNATNSSWHNIPLLTNIHAASVPALVHLDGDPNVRDTWWKKMWYQPYARPLLRKYMRSPTGFDAAQSAMLGGQEWWDLRGGKGGIWTDKGEWLDYSEVCIGFERDLFTDGLGTWGREGNDEDDEEPVYNQFGNLIKGKER